MYIFGVEINSRRDIEQVDLSGRPVRTPQTAETIYKIDTCYRCSEILNNWDVFRIPQSPAPLHNLPAKRRSPPKIVSRNWKWRRIAPGRSEPLFVSLSRIQLCFCMFFHFHPLLLFPNDVSTFQHTHIYPSTIFVRCSFIIPRDTIVIAFF